MVAALKCDVPGCTSTRIFTSQAVLRDHIAVHSRPLGTSRRPAYQRLQRITFETWDEADRQAEREAHYGTPSPQPSEESSFDTSDHSVAPVRADAGYFQDSSSRCSTRPNETETAGDATVLGDTQNDVTAAEFNARHAILRPTGGSGETKKFDNSPNGEGSERRRRRLPWLNTNVNSGSEPGVRKVKHSFTVDLTQDDD